jgi:hypothetical protein
MHNQLTHWIPSKPPEKPHHPHASAPGTQPARTGGDPKASLSPSTLRYVGCSLLWALAAVNWIPEAKALPSFARQMNMQCMVCHGDFPALSEMGRQFKLSGYTLASGTSELPPLAVMIQPSFTHTQAGQAGGAAPGFADNNNYATSQVSLFYAGRLFGPYASMALGTGSLATFLNRFGIFDQTTYDGVSKTWAWDNTELRYADNASAGGYSESFGLYLNNNPTFQDPWNGTPAFGFPYSSSKLAPTPAASALIDGGLAGEVAGLGAYVMIDNHLYLDLGAYRTLGAKAQRELGVDPVGEAQIAGLAPYWRAAYVLPLSGAAWQVGVFGIAADTHPGRDRTVEKDRTVDYGVDSQYQQSFGPGDLTAIITGIYERNRWAGTQQLGGAANRTGSLRELRATADYLWDKTYGLAVQRFESRGTNDELLYGSSQTGSPNSDGWIIQANFLPFNKSGGPAFWPRSNVKFSVQYVDYQRFDGSRRNVDGAGRSAHDNNTLYLEAWIVF